MKGSYCYWSVSDGPYGILMERCVRSARAAGVFKEFHVLTDRPLEGCECYEAYECDKIGGLFKLHYLKVGMSKLSFDWFIWVDADTLFLHNPIDILAPLERAPIHVPLEVNWSVLNEDREWRGLSCFKLRELYRQSGVNNDVYASRSAFWIIQHDAIDAVYELAFQFVNYAREMGVIVEVDVALGYAMQMLCGNPDAHVISKYPEIWGSGNLANIELVQSEPALDSIRSASFRRDAIVGMTGLGRIGVSRTACTSNDQLKGDPGTHPLLDPERCGGPAMTYPAVLHLGATSRLGSKWTSEAELIKV